MPSPRPQLPDGTPQERQRKTRADRGVRRVLEELGEVRRTHGRGRLGDLDRALGRKPGFLSSAIKEQERLSLDRLLAALDFLGVAHHSFFERAFPWPRLPSSPTGYLPQLSPKRRRSETSALVDWFSRLRIDPLATTSLQDPGFLEETSRVDPSAAIRAARATVESLLALRPSSLSPQASQDLCRIVTLLGSLQRMRGELGAACDHLDFAFRVEARLGDAALRSLVFRSAAYLLSDLGDLEEAERFARSAVELAASAADLEGLGRSWYARAVMADRLGEADLAIELYQSCLAYSDWIGSACRIGAYLALAHQHLEDSRVHAAQELAERAHQELGDQRGSVSAILLMVRAEIASAHHQWNEAEALFERCENEFAAYGSAGDIAFARLRQMGCLMRAGQVAQATRLAQELMPLATQLRGSKVHESLLLSIVRSAYQGQLALEKVERAIREWRLQARSPRRT